MCLAPRSDGAVYGDESDDGTSYIPSRLRDGSLHPLTESSIHPHSTSQGEIDGLVVRAMHSGDGLYGIDGDTLRQCAPTVVLTQGLCAVCGRRQTKSGLRWTMLGAAMRR
mmetsp:Transcript_39728/g.54058  ORF Transcript_39728/g.54058 Transcript_39728/m.54058 type:complete len:110 (+) Transcript_39728:315-644(+)